MFPNAQSDPPLLAALCHFLPVTGSQKYLLPLIRELQSCDIPLRPLLKTGQPNVLSLYSSSTSSFVALLWMLPSKDIHTLFILWCPELQTKFNARPQ